MSEFNSFSYGLRAMIDEAGCPIGGERLAPENDRADDSGLSIRGEDTHHIAARIAQKLRDAGFGCAIVNLVPVERGRCRMQELSTRKFPCVTRRASVTAARALRSPIRRYRVHRRG